MSIPRNWRAYCLPMTNPTTKVYSFHLLLINIEIITDSYCLIPCNMMCLEEFKRALELSHIDLKYFQSLQYTHWIACLSYFWRSVFSFILLLTTSTICCPISQVKQNKPVLLSLSRSVPMMPSVRWWLRVWLYEPFGPPHRSLGTKMSSDEYSWVSWYQIPNQAISRPRLPLQRLSRPVQSLLQLYSQGGDPEVFPSLSVHFSRISRLEFFDEYEEWFLMQTHYCVTVASQEDILGTLFPIRHDKCPKISSFQYMSCLIRDMNCAF